jgi:excisionase family DNA binding protein
MKKMTIKQAAVTAGVSESLVRAWLKEGLPHYRFGRRGKRGKCLIDEADLRAFMDECRIENDGVRDDEELEHIR